MGNKLLESIHGNGISIRDNIYKKVQSLTAYVCSPDRNIIAPIKGLEKFTVDLKLNDVSEVSLEVSKYIINESTLKREPNYAYKYLHAFCGVLVPELGRYGYFIIEDEPDTNAESTQNETRSFKAKSYESVLQYENLQLFVVNEGIDESLERLAVDNVAADGTVLNKISLYNEGKKDLSLLDLILENDTYGWKVGHVDRSLWTLQRSFEIKNSNIYSVLRSDISKAFRCIVDFDSIGKVINVYDIETYGKDTNIYMSFDHFIQSLEIKPQKNQIYTVFNVGGDNDLDISAVNFGSNKIVNIDYPLSFLSSGIQNAYHSYEKYREDHRKEYSDLALELANIRSKIDAIQIREPSDDITNIWSSTVKYSLSDLKDNLEKYAEIVKLIEGLYTDSNGKLNLEELESSSDAAQYYSYKSIIIPDITNEIKKRETNSPKSAEKVNAVYVFEVHGIDQLRATRDAEYDVIQAYSAKGYDKTYEEAGSPSVSKSDWDDHHSDYLKHVQYKTQLDGIIKKKEGQINALVSDLKSVQGRMSRLANEVSLDEYWNNLSRNVTTEDGTNVTSENSENIITEIGGFSGESVTYDTLGVIKSLYKESDFQDKNFTKQDNDTQQEIILNENGLLESARKELEIESRPQLTWNVSSDELFAIKEFKPLRDQLQVGDFITLGYEDEDVSFTKLKKDKTFRTTKMRCSEISFDGIDFDKKLKITFSDRTVTDTAINDYENLLDDFVTSKTNSITKNIAAHTSDTVNAVATALVKPYIQATDARIEKATINGATVNDLNAVNAKITTLLTEYIKTNEIDAKIANISDLKANDAFVENLKSVMLTSSGANIETLDTYIANIRQLFAGHSVSEWGDIIHLTAENAKVDTAVIKDAIVGQMTVFDLLAGNITADKSITLVSRNGYGSIVISNATMQFKDETGAVRVQIGMDGEKNYSVNIFSAKDPSGNQRQLWGTSGLQSGAIANGLIVSDMLKDGSVSTNKVADRAITKDKINWHGISESVDKNGRPVFSAGQINVNGESLDTKFTSITKQVNSIESLSPYIISDKPTIVKRNTKPVIKLTAILAGNGGNDVDPSGDKYSYTWYKVADQGNATQIGTGKTLSIEVDDDFCVDTASVYFTV
jgi:hypothetical protein